MDRREDWEWNRCGVKRYRCVAQIMSSTEVPSTVSEYKSIGVKEKCGPRWDQKTTKLAVGAADFHYPNSNNFAEDYATYVYVFR